jgi:hypothetical protein
MYALILAHHRPEGTDRTAFQEEMRGERSGLVRDLADRSDCDTYLQVHQAGRFDPVYQGVRATRSWPMTAPAEVIQGLGLEPWWAGGSFLPQAPWDVVEIFGFERDRRPMQIPETSPQKEAVDRLAHDHHERSRTTLALVAETAVPAPDDGPGDPGVSVLFFLRRRTGMTRTEMQRYWRDEHAPFVVSLQDALGYRTYAQMFVREDAEDRELVRVLGERESGEPYDGIAHLQYRGTWALAAGFVDPRTLIANTRLVADEVTFAHAQRSTMVVGRSHRFAI